MKTYKAVIFDLFDTLVDFDRTQIPVITIDGRDIRTTAGEVYNVLAQYTPDTTFKTYYDTLGAVTKALLAVRQRDHVEIPARRRYELLFDRLGMPRHAAAERCIDNMLATHHRYMHDSTVCPPERNLVLETLKLRYPLGLLSNFDSAATGLKILATHGLQPYFSPIHISEAIGYRKPRREAFLHTAEVMGVRPQEVLFIGDTFALDVVGAKGVGMDVAWFDRQTTPPQPEQAQPDYTISRFTELLEIL
jgi:FMN phosphatase YigB (HAD superfamily)